MSPIVSKTRTDTEMENVTAARKPVPVIVVRPSRGWRAIDFRELWIFRDLLGSLAIRERQIAVPANRVGRGVGGTAATARRRHLLLRLRHGRGTAGRRRSLRRLRVRRSAGLELVQLHHHEIEYVARDARQHGPEGVLPAHAVADLGRARRAARLRRRARDDGGAHRANNTFSGWSILTLPLWVAITVMLATGIGLISSALMVSYRDVGQILPVALQMLLYISPIAYSVEAVPDNVRTLFALNPLVGVLEGFRWCLVEGQPLHISTRCQRGRRAWCCSSSAD